MNISNLALIALFLITSLELHAKGSVSIGQLQRQNDVTNTTADFNTFAELSFVRLEKSGGGFSYQYDLGVRKYNNSLSPLYSMSEAYLAYRKDKLNVSLGRKRVGWNPASSYWTMGEIFATKGFNLASDQDEGLTGLHLEYTKGAFFVEAVASGVFIPQLNPGVEILDGKISRRSEWSNPPPSRVRFEGQNIPIVYNVEMPNATDYITQKSFALSLGFNSLLGRFAIFGGRKPEVNARINATGLLDPINGRKVVVSAKPFVNNQNFYGGSWQKQWSEKFKTAIDYQYINPDRGDDQSYRFAGFVIEPAYTNISYGSFSSTWDSDFFSVTLSGLKAFKNYQTSDTTFEKRLRWQEALGIDVSISPIERLLTGFRYQRDLQKLDRVATGYSSWRFNKKITGSVQYQQIEAPSDQSFWSAYRANDLWEVRLNYLF